MPRDTPKPSVESAAPVHSIFMRRLVTVIVTAFAAGAVAGLLFLVATHPLGNRVETTGTALIGGPFTLTDQNGKTVTEKDFRGRLMLVIFGYTSCPDICPTELQVTAAAMQRLGAKAAHVVPIFVSIDPHRDTPAVLKTYLSHFGGEFVGLTGTDAQIAKVTKEYKVYSAVDKDKNERNSYDLDHSSIIYLMGPDGKYLDHMSFGVTAPEMAQKILRYL